MLAWSKYRNIENSLREFLVSQVEEDFVTDISGDNVPIYIGRKESNDWTLPCITVYLDNENSQRAFIGSNERLNTYLIIIDIFATNEGERLDLASWVKNSINNGVQYYEYSPSETTPNSPIEISGRLINIDFLTNARVGLGQNVNSEDAHRHRISVNAWISGS